MLELSIFNGPHEYLYLKIHLKRYKLGLHLSAFYVNFDGGYPAYFREFQKFKFR
jgi:hypothetical protein